MKIYLPIAKVDAERREVWGYASTESRDDQGEVVKRDALVAALRDYMKFANIREMHQLSAVGVAKEATVDDKGLYVGAKIIDDQAWQKVVEGVYKGYSIGGRVTQRDPVDAKTITGLVLNEISLVDRPANPEAVFDYWRAAGADAAPATLFNPPMQVWACGVAEHRHLAKADALKCQQLASGRFGSIAAFMDPVADAPLEKNEEVSPSDRTYGEVAYADPGYQADGKKRYPIDTEAHIRAAWNFINRPKNARRYTSAQLGRIKARIVSAWQVKIDKDGPPSADNAKATTAYTSQMMLAKALMDIGHVARIIAELQWLQATLQIEAAVEADDSPQPARLLAIIAELCEFLKELVAEETDEIFDGALSPGESPAPGAAALAAYAAGSAGAAVLASVYQGRGPKMQNFGAVILSKASHSDADQALLDLACRAVDNCMRVGGMLFAERQHLAEARDALEAAGARPVKSASINAESLSVAETGMSAPTIAAGVPKVDATSKALSSPAMEVLDIIATRLGKRDMGHQPLLDIAHDCVGKLTDDGYCVTAKAGARHSEETLGHLARAHLHLVAAGARCGGSEFTEDGEADETDVEHPKIAATDLAKMTGGREYNPDLIAALSDILPRLDRLTKRVEDIARTPLPPLAMAKDVTTLSKRQDVSAGDPSPDDLAAAFARMSKEEQTLMLIKASYVRPIQPPGLAPARDPRGE